MYKIYNIGNNKPFELTVFIKAIDERVVVKVEKNLPPLQPGKVLETYADINDLIRDVRFKPEEGMCMQIYPK